LIFGPLVLWKGNYLENFSFYTWLHVKLTFVVLLYVYFYTLHKIFQQQQAGIYKYSSKQLRIWNEVATIFLVAIVMLAVVKNAVSWIWGLMGLVLFVVVLMMAIQLYKKIREGKQ
jgi:putative membrane protein